MYKYNILIGDSQDYWNNMIEYEICLRPIKDNSSTSIKDLDV